MSPASPAQLVEQPLQLVELGRALRLLVDQTGGVAGHARLLQGAEQAVLLHRGQRAALGDLGVLSGGLEGGVVQFLLRGTQRHVQAALDALRELIAHELAVAPQHHRGQTPAQLREVAVAQDLAALVGDVEIHQVAPQGAQHFLVHDLHQGVEVLQAVLQRGAAEHEGVARGDALDRRGDLGAPVLDALGLVQDHQVRAQDLVDDADIAQDQLVVDDEEAPAAPVLHGPPGRGARHHLGLLAGELADLAGPLVFEGGRADHQDALHLRLPVQPSRGGDGLEGLAQAHVVRQQGAAVGHQEGDALDLIRVEPGADPRQTPAGGADVLADPPRPQPLSGARSQTAGVAQGVLAQVDVGAPGQGVGQAQEVLGQPAPKGPSRVEVVVQQARQGLLRAGGAVQADLRGRVRLPVQPDEGRRRRLVLDPGVVPPLGDLMEHRLDVLAGAELVGREVRAGAVVGPPGEGADVDPVAHREVGCGADGAARSRPRRYASPTRALPAPRPDRA